MASRYKTLYTNESHSIYWAVHEIDNGHFVLPLIQRKFVWSMNQMTSLFNSVLKGYPINSILLNKIVGKNRPLVYKFPESVSNYTVSNDKPDKPSKTYNSSKTYSVLDGQQRLTTLRCCFQRDFKYQSKPKGRGYHKSRDYWLFINMTKPCSKDPDGNDYFDIKFKDHQYDFIATSENDDSKGFIWIRLYEIMDFITTNQKNFKSLLEEKDNDGFDKQSLKMANNLISYLVKNDSQRETPALKHKELFNQTVTRNILILLYERFFEDDSVINCVKLNNPESGTTTDVFVNLNSGGTYLSYSDLLFTKLTSYFETEESITSVEERDAKTRIQNTILDKIEDKNDDKFLIRPIDNGSTILKAILVLNASGNDFGKTDQKLRSYSADIGFNKIEKIDKGLDNINKNWDTIAECIVWTYNFIVKDLHLSYKTVTSSYSVIPIILFFWLRGIKSRKDIDNKISDLEKKEIKWYFYSSSLKHVFGRGSGDTILAEVCQEIHCACYDGRNDQNGVFDKFYNATKTKSSLRSKFNISADDISSYLTYEKKNKDTYILLALLYPEDGKKLDMEVDHMHPYKGNENLQEINNIVNLKLYVGHGKKSSGRASNPGSGNEPLIAKALSWCKRDEKKKPIFTSDILLVDQNTIDEINKCENCNNETNPLHINNIKTFFDARREYIKNKLTDSLINLKITL